MKFKKLHNVLASVFAATFFAAPSTSAGLWTNIKSWFGISSSSSNNVGENSTSADNNENVATTEIIDKLISQNNIPVFSTEQGKKLGGSARVERFSYDHYTSIISNKDLNSQLNIKMINQSAVNPEFGICLILSQDEYESISKYIESWEAKKKEYRDRHTARKN